MSQPRILPSLFPLRTPLRAKQLYAILDATSFDNLLGALGKSKLDFDSLFTGEDALLLSGEAPYVVALDPAKPRAVRDLLQAAQTHHAGFVVETSASQDDLRRHFASWLNVAINEGSEMALFRFYDTRILVAFLGTLSATDAAAFWGPADRFYVIHTAKPAVLTQHALGTLAPTAPLPLAEPYQINTQQLDAMTAVTNDVFRARLADFLLRVFWEQGETKTADERDAIVDAAIADCGRLGACREGDVVAMAIVRLLQPDLVASEAYWTALLAQQPNPNVRANIFLYEVAADMNSNDREMYFVKVNYWNDFGKPGEP